MYMYNTITVDGLTWEIHVVEIHIDAAQWY